MSAKNGFKNIYDSVVTTIIGTAIMSTTGIMIWTGRIGWVWEGGVGMLVGLILLIAPDKVPSLIRDFFKSKNQNNTPEGD